LLASPRLNLAAHAVLGFGMADDGLDGRPTAKITLDLRRHPSLLPRDEDPELVIGSGIVAAVALLGEDALDGVADQRLHVRNHRCQRMAIIGDCRAAPSTFPRRAYAVAFDALLATAFACTPSSGFGNWFRRKFAARFDEYGPRSEHVHARRSASKRVENYLWPRLKAFFRE
jgi:hypothetical protein